MKKKNRGFTLVEMIVALSVSSLVLIALAGVAAQMLRSHVASSLKGDVTGGALLSLMQMNRELQDGNVLALPSVAAPSGNVLSGCSNFTLLTNSAIDPARNTVAFYYCVANAGTPPVPCLLRYANSAVGAACPFPAPASCGAAGFRIVARNFYQNGATPFFRRSEDVAGVELNYIVGNPAPTVARPHPEIVAVSTKIGMNKAYNNTVD